MTLPGCSLRSASRTRASNSRWREVRLTGVSTASSITMSPVFADRSAGIPFMPQPHLLAGLAPAGTFTRALPPSIVGTSTSPPSAAVGIADRHAAEQMHPVALEDRVLFHLDEDVKIARRPAAQTGLALTGQPDAGAGLHPCGMFTDSCFSFCDPALAAAGLARVLDDLAHAVAGGAGAFDGEEALLRPHLAHAVAGRAGDRFGPAFRARAVAGVAGDRGRHRDRLLAAGIGLFQRDPQVIAQVRPALGARTATATATAPAHEIAEQVFEHVREGRRNRPAAPPKPPGPPPPPMPPSKAAWPKRS
jgi:hypothetical protein